MCAIYSDWARLGQKEMFFSDYALPELNERLLEVLKAGFFQERKGSTQRYFSYIFILQAP